MITKQISGMNTIFSQYYNETYDYNEDMIDDYS